MPTKKWSQIEMISGKINNHKLSLGAAEEVTYFINKSGSDSGSSPYSIYFDNGRQAVAVAIRASAACSLTQFNGITLKYPLTLNVGNNVFNAECTQLKIVSTGATVVEVTIK